MNRFTVSWGMGACGLAVSLVCWLGCGGGSLDVKAVTGRVTLDGSPVADALVTFIPASEGGMYASGMTDQGGIFRLNTNAAQARPGGGAMAGDYAVTIAKQERPAAVPGASSDPDDPSIDESAAQKAPKPKYIVPKDYGSKETSGLTATVGAGSNDLTFELVSSYKAKPTK
jgi:hypothetical protein